MYLMHWTVVSKIVKIVSVVYMYFTKDVLSWIRNSGKNIYHQSGKGTDIKTQCQS